MLAYIGILSSRQSRVAGNRSQIPGSDTQVARTCDCNVTVYGAKRQARSLLRNTSRCRRFSDFSRLSSVQIGYAEGLSCYTTHQFQVPFMKLFCETEALLALDSA